MTLFDRLIPCWHSNNPKIRDLPFEHVPYEAYTMGNAILGEQGCGKSTLAARMVVDFAIDNPNSAVVAMDQGEENINDILRIAHEKKEWPELRKRIRYIRLGDPLWCKPIPEFSEEHGVPFATQIERVKSNYVKLVNESGAPVLVQAAFNVVLPFLLSILVAMRFIGNKLPWQVIEAAELLDDPDKLRQVIYKLGAALEEYIQRFIKARFLELKPYERELRSYTLGEPLVSVGTDSLVGHLGYYRPVITLKKVIEEGQILLVDGSSATADVQNYIFTQIFSLLMEQIKLRQPHDPKNNKVFLVMDETVKTMRIPGMSQDLSQLASLYRSRGLIFLIILQTLTQLDEEMRKGFWSLANIFCFSLLNKEDAEEVAYQLFDYNPVKVKQEARTETQNNITEPLQGQDRSIADRLTKLKHRELIMRFRKSEQVKYNFIGHVRKTKDVVMKLSFEELNKLKNELMEEGGVPISEVKEVMRRRWDTLKPTPPQKVSA